MKKIKVGRYKEPARVGFCGWIEPQDKSFIIFVKTNNEPLIFINRDKKTGAAS